MTKPMPLAEFTRLPPVARATVFEGLSGAIDRVADAAPRTHGFLRYQWFAAALATDGGQARTILVEQDGDPVIALPMIGFGPGAARLAALPGCDWPFRSFSASLAAKGGAFQALVDSLGREVNALRIGPAFAGDASLAALIDTARKRGWAVLDRRAAADPRTGDMAAAPGAEADDDGAAFAAIGQSAFWHRASQDPALVEAIRAALPAIDGTLATPSSEWLMIRPGLPAMLGRALRHLWERAPA